jgi:hypothetical protein
VNDLADGTYDAIVVDADLDGDGRPDVTVLCLAITAGERKGEIVDVHASHLQHEPIELLAVPCILVVREGSPTVIFD